jgi:phosphoribosylformimino-5-aminoimidazole carboxamide ribotide isomerase
MKVYAAIDLKNGRVVQLVGGDPRSEAVALDGVVDTVRRWIGAGFEALHVIDLDAALGSGDNGNAVETILASSSVPVQVGGGVRTRERARSLVAAGASTVIVGTRGVADPGWLESVAAEMPGRIVLAADVRGGRVTTHGWTEDSGVALADLLARVSDVPLAGVLVTDVDREGRMPGVNTSVFAAAARATAHPVIAAGGIAGDDDIRRLADTGISSAVVGMALYTGKVTLTRVGGASAESNNGTAREPEPESER